jgi:solute carrier family 10 (sodium/bile acid cotransporter), member 7
MKIDGSILAMIGAIILALLAPQAGATGGPLHIPLVTGMGIGLVFFLHGAGLSPHALKAGATNWKLHLLIHATTFVLFPALGLTIFFGAGDSLPIEAKLGVFYLCALCSTISSSVAMTALARGNVAGAVFNATLSGLLGMAFTPLLLSLVTTTGASEIPLLPAILDVAKKLLAPFVAGQLCRPLLGGLIAERKAWVTKIDRSVIVLIVYGAFCNFTAAKMWGRYDVLLIGELALIAAGLLGAVLALTTVAARLVGMPREDEIAAVFCGSTKSLANGAPIASVLFANNPGLGLILLPLMIYHQLQLIACASLAPRYARQAEASPASSAAA